MSHIGMDIPKSAKGFLYAWILPELCPHLCGIADRKTPYMRSGLIISLLLLLTSSLFAQHIQLLAKHPTLVRDLSVKHLSSYLGIQPESLSRIRKALTRN
jgi:hypothetical protein